MGAKLLNIYIINIMKKEMESPMIMLFSNECVDGLLTGMRPYFVILRLCPKWSITVLPRNDIITAMENPLKKPVKYELIRLNIPVLKM